jgi:predicted ATPase
MAINESNGVGAVVFVVFSQGLCGHWKFRCRLALHWRSDNRGGNSQGKLWEKEIHRTAGEIALLSPAPDAAKAETYFERALAVARAQQAKSWELRAAMSMARLWGDQGKRDSARGVLAPVYGWFTEGFDTLDLKEAKALLDALAS